MVPGARASPVWPARTLIAAPCVETARATVRRWAMLLHVLALAGLFMFPVEMRAGTERPHPHALLHLLVDASDGAIDHHALPNHPLPAIERENHETSPETLPPDLPSTESSVTGGTGLVAIPALILQFLLMPGQVRRIWPHDRLRQGYLPPLETPPPQAE